MDRGVTLATLLEEQVGRRGPQVDGLLVGLGQLLLEQRQPDATLLTLARRLDLAARDLERDSLDPSRFEALVAGPVSAVLVTASRALDERPGDETAWGLLLDTWDAWAESSQARAVQRTPLAAMACRTTLPKSDRWRDLPDGVLWLGARLFHGVDGLRLALFARGQHGHLLAKKWIDCGPPPWKFDDEVSSVDQSLETSWRVLQHGSTDTEEQCLRDSYARAARRLVKALDDVVGPFVCHVVGRLPSSSVDLVVEASGPLVCAPWDLLPIDRAPLYERVRSVQLASSVGAFLRQTTLVTGQADTSPRRVVLAGVADLPIGSGRPSVASQRLARRGREVARTLGLPDVVVGPIATEHFAEALQGTPCLAAVHAHGLTNGLLLPSSQGADTFPPPELAPGSLRGVRGLFAASCFAGRTLLSVQPQQRGRWLYGPAVPLGAATRLGEAGVQAVFSFTQRVADLEAVEVTCRTMAHAGSLTGERFSTALARNLVLRELGSEPSGLLATTAAFSAVQGSG